MRRTKPLARGPLPRSRDRIRRAGARTKQWERARRQLKRVFADMGIVACEGGWEDCTVDNFLSFAHTLKRRNITTEEQLKRCALLCWNCHWKAERGGEARMTRIIEGIIEGRAARLAREVI